MLMSIYSIPMSIYGLTKLIDELLMAKYPPTPPCKIRRLTPGLPL
jgi:hypothetical protein